MILPKKQTDRIKRLYKKGFTIPTLAVYLKAPQLSQEQKEEIIRHIIKGNPERPPREWFYACVRSVSKDPSVTDPNAVCAWNWYHFMTRARRREILRGKAIFDPDVDLTKEEKSVNALRRLRAIFDPKITMRGRTTRYIRLHYKKVYYIFTPKEMEIARQRYLRYIKKKGRLRPYQANAVIPR